MPTFVRDWAMREIAFLVPFDARSHYQYSHSIMPRFPRVGHKLVVLSCLMTFSLLAGTVKSQAQTYELAPPTVILTDVEFVVTADVQGDSLGMEHFTVTSGGHTSPLAWVIDDDLPLGGAWTASGFSVP